MKKQYVEAELEILRLEALDVITTSDPDNGDDGDVTGGNW